MLLNSGTIQELTESSRYARDEIRTKLPELFSFVSVDGYFVSMLSAVEEMRPC
uniref:DNA-directed DNA polymerase n=1 Tax=Heterorhabditis bacteriophora TaxID=37862 RepID=A0A1I7WPN0_HETBA